MSEHAALRPNKHCDALFFLSGSLTCPLTSFSLSTLSHPCPIYLFLLPVLLALPVLSAYYALWFLYKTLFYFKGGFVFLYFFDFLSFAQLAKRKV